MSANARNVIIAVVGILALGSAVCASQHYGAEADVRKTERWHQCLVAGGSFIDQPTEMCLVGKDASR